MNDYEKLAAELEDITNRLDGLAVPDADLDNQIYDATDALKSAKEKASERA